MFVLAGNVLRSPSRWHRETGYAHIGLIPTFCHPVDADDRMDVWGTYSGFSTSEDSGPVYSEDGLWFEGIGGTLLSPTVFSSFKVPLTRSGDSQRFKVRIEEAIERIADSVNVSSRWWQPMA